MADSERGCCVPRCGKTRNDDTVLHSFPNPDKDMERYLEWTRAVGMSISSLDPHYVYRNRRVCHAHFEIKYLTWSRRLSPNAVPTLLLPGSESVRVPLIDITKRSDTVFLDAALTPTSREMETSGVPHTNTTNQNENALLVTALPSTSRGDPLAQEEPIIDKTKLHKSTQNLNEKELIKTVNKLQIKKGKYATRLKKALNLSENKTFQNTIKKFTPLAAMFTLMQFRETGKNKMGRRFTKPEKIMALCLYKRSPRTYRWLQKIFVLPSAITLSRLIARANLKTGINKTSLNN